MFFYSFFWSVFLFADSFNTINIDGNNTGWNSNETFTNCSTADNAYFTWDETYIYIGISDAEADYGNVATFLIIDADPSGSNGSNSAYAWSEFITVPFKADYVVVWKNSSDYIEVRDYNDGYSTWDQWDQESATSLNTNDVNFSIGTDYREVRIKRSIIGNPIAIKTAMFTEQQWGSFWRYFTWPSNGWTDAARTSSQSIPNYYGFILNDGMKPIDNPYYNADIKTFDNGGTGSDWATAANWSGDVLPTTSTLCIIPSSKSSVEISATSTANCYDLLVLGSLTILSTSSSNTGSLIANGTESGNITVERYLDESSKAAKWHYVSSPVAGQLLDNSWMTTNSILTGTGGKYQLFRYDEEINYWIIYGSTGDPEAFTDDSFVDSRGYSVARDGAGVISFEGTMRTDDVTYPATYTADKGKGWNLVGNPFTSAIGVTNSASSTGKFLSANSGVIDANYLALYIWDEQATYENYRNDYKVISNSDIDGYTEITQNYIQPGQAFMVKVAFAGNLAFNKNMQYHADVNFYKSKETWPSVELVVEGNGVSNSTSVGFHEDMTAGLDPSYDVGKLKGNPDIALYTRLVEDNGVDFAIQALPFENIETVEIPVGISVSTPGVYEFSASTTNFENYNIVLEDRQTNVYTNLKWDKYSAEINQSGIGRFYLHFKDATGIEDNTTEKEPLTFYTPNTLTIRNLQPGTYQITVSDIAGRRVAAKKVTTDGSVEMPLSLQTGVYIVEVSSETMRVANKIIIK